MEFSSMTIDMSETGKRIACAREKAGISVRDLQAVLGFDAPSAIYKWQRGECLPTIDHLVILSALLHVSIDELVAVNGEQENGR